MVGDDVEAHGVGVNGVVQRRLERVPVWRSGERETIGASQQDCIRALTVTVGLKGGKKVSVLVGNKKGEDEYYAKTPEGAQVFIVKKYNADRVMKRPIEFRDKTLCDIADSDVTEIAVSNGDNSYTITKSGIAKRNEALRGSGGRAMVKLKVAEAIEGKSILLIPGGQAGHDFQPVAVGKLVFGMCGPRHQFQIYFHRDVPRFQAEFRKQLGQRRAGGQFTAFAVDGDPHGKRCETSKLRFGVHTKS